MASVWKDPRSSNWIACFTDKNGLRRKKTTDTRDRKKAQRIADTYEVIATRKQTSRTIREIIASLAKEIWGVDSPSTSVKEHFQSWIEEKRSGSADSTVSFYQQSTDKFLEFLGPVAEQPLDSIDRSRVAAFKSEMAKKLAPKTVNHHLKCLRMIFNAARRDGLIDDNPLEFIDAIKKVQSHSRRAFKVEELKRVLEACDAEWRSMVMCGLYTGQRLADTAMLIWQNVDLTKSEIYMVTRKTKKRLTIPISPPLLRHLENLPSSDDPKAPIHPRSFQVVSSQKRTGTLSNQFSSILVKAGLRDASCLDKQSTGKGRSAERVHHDLSFHSLRHTAVTMLKEAGIPAAVVMELIGHDSEQMSQHYTNVGLESLVHAASVLPDISGHQKVSHEKACR